MSAGAARRAIVRMAWRETRGAWRHFAGFSLCVALGVAALTAVGTLAANVDRALTREAKALMGGDLELRSPRPLGDEAREAVERLRAAGAAVSTVRELVGMAREPEHGRTLLVEVKAVEPSYPLYGRLDASPAESLPALLAGGGALVHRDLLERLGVRPGAVLLLGAARVTVRGVVEREPDAPGGFALGPRVLVAAETLEATGLVRPGSRVRYRTLVRLPGDVAARDARERVARDVTDVAVRVTAFNEAQPGLRRFFSQVTTYLGLVGLVSLLVGGVGVASAVATFVRRQRPTIAILKCLGAGSRVLLATYVLQTQAIALVAGVAGAALGVALQPLVVRALAGVVPLALEARADPWTVARAIAMGSLTALACALWPLLAVRDVPPSLVLRQEVDATVRPRRPWRAALPILAALAALAVWQAGSLKLGGIFIGAGVAALALLAAFARAASRAAGMGGRLRALAWRQGLANLRRPGGQTVGTVVALGTGVMLLVAIALLEGSLGRQIDHERRREAPSFFFVDVQPDQVDAFTRLVRDTGGAAPVLTPVVRSRLAAVNGTEVTAAMTRGPRRPVDRETPGGEAAWYLRREYVLTFAEDLPATNTLVKGRWWRAPEWRRPLVSIEESAARHLGVDVGDRLAFDVQGVRVEGEVTSIRRVDWQSLTTNFFVIFSPGALDGAPATWVATVRVPPAAETAVQNAVVAAFPNVTALAVRDVLERVAGVLDRIALAIRVMALFSIAAGLVVMASALSATRYARLRESVIWRTLGATRGVVARIFAVEYACLGAAAGVGGTALAVLLSWVVLRFVLEVPWTFEPQAVALGVALTVATSVAVGGLGTFRLLGEKPLPVLRRD
jgi:putative ABC transport system permease protein